MKNIKTQENLTEEYIKRGFDIEQEEQQEFIPLRKPLNVVEVETIKKEVRRIKIK